MGLLRGQTGLTVLHPRGGTRIPGEADAGLGRLSGRGELSPTAL